MDSLAPFRLCPACHRHRFFHQAPKILFAMLVPMLIFNSAIAEDAESAPIAATDSAQKVAVSPIRYAGVLYKASNRRDPFLNPLLGKKDNPKADAEEARGNPPPGIAGTFISQATLQGISIRDKGRVAIVRGADDRAYFLREGDRLFDGYVKNIEIDRITLVHETKMRSGKISTREVTKWLRTP